MTHNPANLLGLDYRRPPAPRLPGFDIVDIHTHLRGDLPSMRLFFDAAKLYGVRRVLTMTFLEYVPLIRRHFADTVEFIAVPDYRLWTRTPEFQQRWCDDIRGFAKAGARICKFWAAPRALAEHGLTLDDAWLRPMIDTALGVGLGFMVHVADPDLWYATKYSDAATFGAKAAAYHQLEWFLDYVAPRPVIGAHFLGHPEDLDHLDDLLGRYPHLMLDTSATKWISREVSRHKRERVRAFFRRHRERILFGSDLVLDPNYDFDHYASRYWVQQRLWESDYDGDSPIQDPDIPEGVSRLRGANLPDDDLRAVYRENYERLMKRIAGIGRNP
ncbi:MAG: hypothetical protein PHU85_09045 [Phycisphaerae bacterium]|nr:hypothetical protein [Phycisphaerae bacterium]